MELFQQLIFGFGVALSFQNLLYCFIGVLVGTLIGVLPGIGPLGTIAILLPITFNVAPVGALIMLAGIYYGAQYGGSTTAILVNLPGETSSVVTCIDGYQMARQGRAGPALAIAAIGSFFAGTVGTLIIALFGPPLADIALQFAAPEYFSLMLMGLVAAAVLAQGDIMKSIAMVALGLLLGIVGRDVNTGVERYSFGITELSDGIGFIVVAVGIFAMGEIIANLGDPEKRTVFNAKVTHLFPTWQDMKQSIGPILRGTAIGSFFGVLPGTGPAIASFSSYMVEKKLAADPSRFGRGAIEGVAGPESANNADAQCKFIPMLTLGLPASGVMALMLGAMTIQGIQPGPRGDDRAAGAVLGPRRQHVDRQPHAGGAQPAADRAVGETSRGAVPAAVSGHHGVLRHRHLQREQLLLRDLSHRPVRRARLRVVEARLPAGAAAARLRARPDDGGKPPPSHADGEGRPLGFRNAADQPDLYHHHDRNPRRHDRPGGEDTARRDHGLNAPRSAASADNTGPDGHTWQTTNAP